MEWLEINHPEWLRVLPIKFGGSDEVECALNVGSPAAVLMLPPGFRHEENTAKIHIAFDWDSTLSDRSGDELIESQGRNAFTLNETKYKDMPCERGPMVEVLEWLQGGKQYRCQL